MHAAFDEAAMADDYQVLEELGSGSFGVVYKAIEKSTGDLVAIKHIDLEGNDDDIREIQQEISLLSTCSSEFVTRYKASFVRGVKLWIVMEYLGGGSCLDLLKRGPFTEPQIAIVMRELLQGLDYLHSTGKIHRDIKAANVLLSNAGHVKLADFGVAAQLTNIKSQRMTFVGTPFWMAPEVIQEAGYDFRADIWSLGITAMELGQGEPPHSDVHPMKVLFLIPKQPPPRLDQGNWSRDFRDFVAACLNKDPDRRPTARALLKHRFVQKAGRIDVLKDLVQKVHKLETARDRGDRARYYEETLRQLPPPQDDDDDWVFDTVKATTRQPPPSKQPRRKLSRIPSDESSDTNCGGMERLDLQEAPLMRSPPRFCRATRPSSTIQTPQAQAEAGSENWRRSSAVTARKVSLISPTASARRKIRDVSGGLNATARRVSNQQRQALDLNMSFGNGTSIVRQFRRVSSGGSQEHHSLMPASASMPQLPGTPPDSDAENRHLQRPQALKPVMPASKEALLGRRAYSKALEPSFQECLAQTSDSTKRAGIFRVAEAWSQLDERDPEGALLLFRAMISKVQADPKLAAHLMPQHVVGKQLASLRMPKVAHKGSPSSQARAITKATDSPTPSPIKQSTPASSPSKAVSFHQQQRCSQQTTPRRKDSRVSPSKEADERLEQKLPGHVEKGQEHVAQLADVLYGKWCEGLQARWGMT